MRQPERPDDADTPLRLCYTGPGARRDRQEAIERRFGLRVVVGYAMSESPYGLIWPHGTRPFGTLGRPGSTRASAPSTRPGWSAEAGQELGRGETGELLLRNPVVTPGYWGMPEETATTIVDGWLHTGDLVTVDAEGTYTFVPGRRRSAAPGREPLAARGRGRAQAHPDVSSARSSGCRRSCPRRRSRRSSSPGPRRALDFARFARSRRRGSSAFKVPRYWQAIDALPRTPTARVAKHRLPRHPPEEYDAEHPARRRGSP